MSETTEGVELAVPDEAKQAMLSAPSSFGPEQDIAAEVRRIAGPVVAHELRLHADRYAEWAENSGGPWSDAMRGVSVALSRQADRWERET